uniref:Uncharacterized protein n=1 Tax=Terrapene triunguis TaxID=2587831 RepID=A0A674K790_9SAUR
MQGYECRAGAGGWGVGGGAVCRKGLRARDWGVGGGSGQGVGVQMGCGVWAPARPRLPGAASGWQRLAPRPWGRGRAEGPARCPRLWVPHPKLPLAGNREPRPMGASGVEPTYEGSALSPLPLPSPRATGTWCRPVPGAVRGTRCHGEFWQYNSFQYWRAPLPAIDLSVILDLDGENMTDARTTSRIEIIETEMET